MMKIPISIMLMCPLICFAGDQLKLAVTEPIPVSDLVGYTEYPSVVKNLISDALNLSKQNLTYMYGSNDPKNHGMDCSGTMYYLLNKNGVKDVPRSADGMYQWVKKNNTFYSDDLSKLKPGDLLFWSGTSCK